MVFVSHAQNYEDILLRRVFSDLESGFYIDVGAAWPDQHSVTKAFYDQGWSGINVEPNPKFFGALEKNRVRDINLKVAVSNKPGTAKLNLIEGTGLSTLDSEIAEQHRSSGWEAEPIEVEVVTLDQIWDKYVAPEQDVHFLKIDVEGLEENVIRGKNWTKNRPWLLVVEATLPLSTDESYHSWDSQLVEAGYTCVYVDGLNRFYLADEHIHLKDCFRYPPNVFDDFVTADEYLAKKELTSAKEKLDTLTEELSRLTGLYEKDREVFEKATEAVGHMENSLSWKITQPLRTFNPKRLIAFFIRMLGRQALKSPRLVGFVKPRLERHPFLWEWIKRIVLFDQLSTDKEEFIRLQFEDFDLDFASGPLKDSRGIGRVTKELLAQLSNFSSIEELVPNSDAERGVIRFYSSIHWCPSELPEGSVVMIHDVIPLLFPERFPAVAREWQTRYKLVAQKASLIVTISQTSAKDIARYLEVPEEKIHVIYNGVKPLPLLEDCRVQLPPNRYAVFFGSHDHHKNISVLLEAFKDPEIKDIDLVMIGDNNEVRQWVAQLGIQDRVRFYGRLNDPEAGFLLANALTLLFPSLYEGFGLPPFEAALSGTPSICSRRPAMTELLEESALFVDPNDPRGWVEAIKALASDENLAHSLAAKARNVAQEFTWDKAGLKLVKSFELLAHRRAS